MQSEMYTRALHLSLGLSDFVISNYLRVIFFIHYFGIVIQNWPGSYASKI